MGFIKPNNNSGGSGGGLTPQELSRLNNAYTHSKSEHAPTTAEQNVQPDWNETDTTSDAYIKNKPDLSQIGSGGNIPSVTQIEPQELDMPKVFFYGNALPTTKDNVNLTMDYISNTAKFSSFVKLKCQGTSSMSYAKKNFTITMFSDEARETKLKKDFKGWGAQSKFCLKANYVDTTHTRNISGARIAYDMVASRPDSAFKQQLLQCPRNGLVDGFPIKLYFNGEFYGIYTWNIPKDAWMFNMNKSNLNHIVLCAEKNTDGNSSAINSCQFRQLWTNGDGQDWSVEVGTMSEDLRTKFNRVIAFVMNATDQEFHDNIGEYFDLYSLLDYYCFSYLTCHLDGLAKNMLMATYDGVIWGASLYDMDSIYGVSWNGGSFVSSQYQCPEQYQEQFSRLWVRIEQCFATELYARYLELRQGALSLSNIVKHVEEIYDVIPDRVFADEKAKWTSLPNVNTNTMTRFRNYMRDRAVYVDAQMQELGTKVPCTGIVLSTDTLSFTTTNTQTLSVVVSPTNCTDTVTWSVSPTGVVSVNNGVVTPITNGTCTITVTCGSYSDTCAVTVSGIEEQPGDEPITLTKTLTQGKGFDKSTGEVIPSTSPTYGACEEYIPVIKGNTYTINGCGGWITVVGYNSDKTFNKLITTGSGTITTYQFANDCDYIRVGCSLTSGTTITITGVFSESGGGTPEVPEENLLCYYDSADLTTSSTTWTDKTGNGRDLTINKNSEASLDITDQGLLFYNVYCRTPELNIPLTGNFTVEYELTRLGNISGVAMYAFNSTVNKTCVYCDSIRSNHVYAVNGYNTDTNTDLILTQDHLYKIRVIYGNEITLYADGVLIGTYTRNAFTANGTYQLCLGFSGDQKTPILNSRIKSFKLWDGIVEPSGGDTDTNPNLVFKVDSTCMNTADNTLTDSVAGISATLVGNPTVSGNQIAFDVDDTFSFNISSLNLTSSNRTFRIKFTPTNLADTVFRNVIGIGSSDNNWRFLTSSYINSTKLILQHGIAGFTNHTVGSPLDNSDVNRLSTAPVTGQEYELVISENTDGNIRWFVDGTLVQDGITTTLDEPLYISNTEGTGRFIGSYSLIEIYNTYCNDYTEFTNMVNSRNA